MITDGAQSNTHERGRQNICDDIVHHDPVEDNEIQLPLKTWLLLYSISFISLHLSPRKNFKLVTMKLWLHASFLIFCSSSNGFVPQNYFRTKQYCTSGNQSLTRLASLVDSGQVNGCSCSILGGELSRIGLENEDDGFLTKLSVPIFRTLKDESIPDADHQSTISRENMKRLGLEGIVPGAFIVENAISTEDCQEIIEACEQVGFGKFDAGRNRHGAMQILVTPEAAEAVGSCIFPFIDMKSVNEMAQLLPGGLDDIEFDVAGLNRRWRVYRYDTDGEDSFAPHIDAGFPPSTLSKDGSTLIWDALEDTNNDEAQAYAKDTVSRLTVLMYLNHDFQGGHTKFYSPVSEGESSEHEVLAAVKPKAGSILLFPQAVGEEAVDFARLNWPLHEGSPVTGGTRPKYVIRSDILFTKARDGLTEEEKIDPLWQYDELVRSTFLPQSPAFSSEFLNHIQSIYNPHMGVENVGPLLYSLIRFTKKKTVVEIGAGFTTPWILQALKDNDIEMANIKELNDAEKCRLLNVPWTPENVIRQYHARKSSLLCIDNCLHQRETATGAGAVAKTLGLSEYLEFIQGDAYDMDFESESIDLLWCDFGVGSRMKEFAKGAWKAIRPGGFLVCHSTLTNARTREWLEAVRSRSGEDETGMPVDEFVEISFLEPQKTFQNSISILQRRKSSSHEFHEPIYSEYA